MKNHIFSVSDESKIKCNLDLQPSSWRLRSVDNSIDNYTCCIYGSGFVYSVCCVKHEYYISPLCII